MILSNLDAALRGGWFGLVTQRFSWLEYRARHSEIPGFSIAVLSDDDIVFSQAYGWADVEERQPIATGHLFNVGITVKNVYDHGYFAIGKR